MVTIIQAVSRDILVGSIGIVFSFLKILIPLMIITEILMVYKVIEKMADKFQLIATLLRMEKQSLFPLFIGVFMGLTYGAGTLIEINDRTPIPKRDMVLIGIFLFICHAIIETSLIFAVAGANVWVVSLGRLLFAFIITFIAARLPFIDRIGR